MECKPTVHVLVGGSAVVVVEEDEEEQRDGGRGGGEGEEVVFRVTRHTPHHLHGGQRRLLTPETTPHSAGKRMKLDDTLSAAPAVTAQGQCTYLLVIVHSLTLCNSIT